MPVDNSRLMPSAVQPGINRDRIALRVQFCAPLVCSVERSLVSFYGYIDDSAYVHLLQSLASETMIQSQTFESQFYH